MIRIHNNIPNEPKDDPLAEVLQDPFLHKELFNLGIYIGDYPQNYDFVFAMANDLKEPRPCTIGFERIDGCQVRNTGLLKEENLRILVKMYKYKGLGVSNLSCAGGRMFTRFLTKENWEDPAEYIKEKHFSKIVPGLNFLHYKRHDHLMEFSMDLNLDNHRSIDVYFGGTTIYGKHGHQAGELITKHRLNCIDAVKSLADMTILTTTERVFHGIEYHEMLHDCKIVVSPWGWGESCYRDYEALILGCELIKPKSFAIESIPDIYNDHFVYYCEPDFSDLQKVVNKAMAHYSERTAQRAANSCYIRQMRSYKEQAGILKGIIMNAICNKRKSNGVFFTSHYKEQD